MTTYQNLPGLIKGSQGILGVIQRAQVSLTTAQILALFTTPVSLIPAPGVGKAISIEQVTAKVLSTGKTAFAGANAVEVRYTNGAGTKLTASDLAAAWLNNATDRADKVVGAAHTLTANAPVVAVVPTANPTTGTGTVTFDVLYRVVDA